MLFNSRGEYVDHEVIDYLKSCGIQYEITAAHSPAQKALPNTSTVP